MRRWLVAAALVGILAVSAATWIWSGGRPSVKALRARAGQCQTEVDLVAALGPPDVQESPENVQMWFVFSQQRTAAKVLIWKCADGELGFALDECGVVVIRNTAEREKAPIWQRFRWWVGLDPFEPIPGV